jgi:hypothetical protein
MLSHPQEHYCSADFGKNFCTSIFIILNFSYQFLLPMSPIFGAIQNLNIYFTYK